MLDVALEIDAACIAGGQSRITALESDGERYDLLHSRLGQRTLRPEQFLSRLESQCCRPDELNSSRGGAIRTLTRRGRKARIDRTCWALKRSADNVIDTLRVGHNGRKHEGAVFGECCSVT